MRIIRYKYNGEKVSKEELLKIFTKELLIDEYENNKLSISDIVSKYKISCLFINYCFAIYDIKKRSDSERNKLSVQKANATCMKHYGVKRPLMCKSIYNKCQDTWSKKYGSDHIWKLKKFQEKSKQTLFNNYGVLHPYQSSEIQNKGKDTCLEKYGCEFATQTQQMKEKSKKTCLEKYGVEYSLQSQEVKEKSKQTCLSKYGTEYSLQSYGVRSHTHHKYCYKNKKFDSAPEVAFYIWLEENSKEKFEYQPNIKFEYFLNNKKHYYYPDFKVGNLLYEIKGDYFFEDEKMIDPYNRNNDGLANEKYITMIKNNIIILREKDYSVYLNYVSEKYGKNYINSLRNKTQGKDL